jgi:uncharacterized surface anchored protein
LICCLRNVSIAKCSEIADHSSIINQLCLGTVKGRDDSWFVNGHLSWLKQLVKPTSPSKLRVFTSDSEGREMKMHYNVIQLGKRKILIAFLIVAAIAFIPAVAHAGEETSMETAVDDISDSSSANSSTAAAEATTASDNAGSEQQFDSSSSDTALQEPEPAAGNLAPEEDNSSAPFAGDIVAAPEDAPEGNSYKAEINVGATTVTDPTDPPHTTPDQDIVVKVTFTELGESTLLGSARIDLAADFDYTNYADGDSNGLTVKSSHGDGVNSHWNAVWETVDTQQTIMLTADYTSEDVNGYLAKDDWVSVLFNAQAPATEGEHTFATTAWTDHTQTTTNNMHPDYRNPTIVVSEQVSYRIIENILTDVEIEQILEDNSRVAVPDPMPHPDDGLLDLDISYQFILPPGHQYDAGAFFEFTLPGEFAVHNEVTGNLVDGESNIFGQYLLSTNRTVRLTFNDDITTYELSGLQGWVNFQTEVREDLDGDLRREIEINIRDNTLVRIPLNFEAKAGSSIDKRGVPNRGETANQTYNADSITWEVDFNKDLQTIENAVLRDPLGTNLNLVKASVQLYLLRVQLDGSVVSEATPVPGDQFAFVTSADESVDEGFEIRFNSDEISDAYRLVFRTGIDQDGITYTNTATLTGSNITPLEATASVSVDRGAVIEKDAEAYNQDSQAVDWEIRINYNLKTIQADDSTVTDTYGPEQSLVGSSLKVWLVTLDDDGVEVPSTAVEQVENTHYTFNPVHADPDNPGSAVIGFEINFIGDVDGNITDAYRINYRTVPVDRVQGTVTLNNTAQFSGESDGASQTLSQSILSKTHQSVDYADKTVQWTIVINRDQHPMDNLEVTDTFTNSGLTLTPGDPSIPAELRSAVAVTGLPVGVTYDIALLAEGEGFIIDNFRDGSNKPVTISDTITITYTTVFAYEGLTPPANNFRNDVRLDWDDANDVARNINVTRIFTPNQQTMQNGYKGGSYNATTKVITWTVGVNYNLREVSDAQVFDYILGNQSLVADSIAVYSATINSDGTVTQGAALNQVDEPGQYQLDQTVTGPGSETNPGFRITLVGDNEGKIDSLYIIEYQTSLLDRVIAGQYDNTAYLYSESDLQTTLDATVSNQNWGIYTSKQGDNEGRTVTWQIDINPGLSQLTDVEILDNLSPGQSILRDSVKVYTTTVTGANGSYVRAAELVRDTDYTVEFSGSINDGEHIKLSLIGDHSTINSAYIVEYQTFIEFVYHGQVSNSAVLTANTTELPDDTGDSEDIGGRITSGEGGISGFLGRLVVRKTDISTGSLLPGAQFELRHESGDTVIATATSGTNGTAVFNNVLFGSYRVTEVQPPTGYALDDPDPRTITLSSSSSTLTFSNTQLPDEDGDDDNGGPDDNGDDDTSTGDDPDPGSDRGSVSPDIWNVLNSDIEGLSVAKKADAEAQLSVNARELPRTGGTGIYQILIISGLALTAGYFAYKRSFKIK